jgi:hypothetical protein
MSMIKIIDAGTQDFGDMPPASLIKVSRKGLIGDDLRQLEKRASATLTQKIQKVASLLRDDEPLIHLIAIGATEDYGANRNADGFTRKTCQQHHPTFQKFAHFYRDHKNKDPKKSYGHIKLSMWNEPMKRIELLVALNGSEDAARRNGGLYADKEMQKLASGKEIPVSMACRVAYDVCSWCNNKSRTREDYCTSLEKGGKCEAGGLKDNLGALVEMVKNGQHLVHQLHADNPNPTFFDISHVFRPADRIAYVSGLLEKSAGHGVIGGSALAEALGVAVPYSLLVDSKYPANVQTMLKLAYQLSDMEASLESGELLGGRADKLAPAFLRSVQCVDVKNPAFLREKFSQTLRALADERIALPLENFIELVADYGAEKAAAAAEIVQRELPGVYSRLLARSDFVARVSSAAYTPGPAASPVFRLWATKQAQALSLAEDQVCRRATLAAVRQEGASVVRDGLTKTASDNGPVTRLAEEYALYKLAFLSALPEDDQDQLTAHLVLVQNYAN